MDFGTAHRTTVPPWYNPRKVAQIVAYFACREGGVIPVLKAVKLSYLADRRHMKKHAHPLFHDNVVSMRHGPVHAITYDLINGIQEKETGWDEFLENRSGYRVASVKKFVRGDLGELSNAEMVTLGAIWNRFGPMDQWRVCDWICENCPEWEDPHHSSMPLPHERIFGHLGYPDAAELAREVETERRIDEFWASPPEGLPESPRAARADPGSLS